MTAFEKINARLRAGERVTIAECEAEIASDPVAAAAFKTLAVVRRTGLVDITLADVARRTGFPVGFLHAAELARINGTSIVGAHLVHETEALH